MSEMIKNDSISIVGIDDLGNSEIAYDYAKLIISNPNIIAVIGHSTSGTTIEPTKLYSGAGIPILMPIATSPKAGENCDNYFRLPLSDVDGQIPAIVSIALDTLKAGNICIVGDYSVDAIHYSKTFFTRLEGIFKKKISQTELSFFKFDKDDINTWDQIQPYTSDTELIIFCGYGSNANVFLKSLRANMTHTEDRPTLILTDGCKVPNLDTRGFSTYLTFPIPDISQIDYLGSEFVINSNIEQSYHLNGFDAIKILDYAIVELESSSKILSRSSLLESLSKSTVIEGIYNDYTFKNGENINGHYYVYYSSDSINSRIRMMYEFDFIGLEKIKKKYNIR